MDLKNLQEFMELLGRLKHLSRKGWVYYGVEHHETIAGHMLRMAVLSLVIDSHEKLDKNKIIHMSLIHDLAECIVGDLTPLCGVSVEEKHRREDEAMVDICKLLGPKEAEFLQLFREYESQESPEAKFVKDLDRLDLLSQAYEYEKRDKTPGKFEEFFVANTSKIQHPFLKKMADEIIAQRLNITDSKN